MRRITPTVPGEKRHTARTICIVLSVLVVVTLTTGSALGKVKFSDDFESGNLDRWQAVGGEWEIIEVDGNRVARTKGSPDGKFMTLNIRNWAFDNFTMDARIWQVSLDQGANIYFHNDHSHSNPQRHSGYWFGISGAFRAVGWGTIDDGVFRRWDTQRSAVPLNNWVRLRLEVQGRRATMWMAGDHADDKFQQIFDVINLAKVIGKHYATGHIGFIATNKEVWVDDVVVTGDGTGLAVDPRENAAVLWGQLKRVN